MTHRHAHATTEAATADPVIQRACACGKGGGVESKCPDCAAAEKLSVQTRLRVNAPGDAYEREADRVADQVVSGHPGPAPAISSLPMPPLQRQADEDEEELQTKAAPGRAPCAAPEGFAGRLQRAAAGGRPLPSPLRGEFERRMGRDLARVRIHDGSDAQALSRDLHARAFTHRNDIFFGAGQFDPESKGGRHLLAHELAHTVQQKSAEDLVQRAPPEKTDDEDRQETADKDAIVHEGEVGELDAAPGTSAPRVTALVVDCDQMRAQFQTQTRNHTYHLSKKSTCNIRGEEHVANVARTGKRISVTFPRTGASPAGNREFRIYFKLERGKENPLSLLKNQSRLTVRYASVGGVSEESETVDPHSCRERIASKTLVKKGVVTKGLFQKPLKGNTEIWNKRIPLGQFGWVKVGAEAGYTFDGRYHAEYGPGMLSGICITHPLDAGMPGSAGEAAELAKRLLPGNAHFGGRAKFKMSALAVMQLQATGWLRIPATYLDLFEIGAVKGELKATGTGKLAGEINAEADVLYEPVSGDFALAADVGVGGRAGLDFELEGTLGATFAGFDIWSQTWKLAKAQIGLGWMGGVKYSANPGIKIARGRVTAAADRISDFQPGAFDADLFGDDVMLDGEKGEEVVKKVLDPSDEKRHSETYPKGLSEKDAIPYTWTKPVEFYPAVVPLPNAVHPQEIHRDVPEQLVEYTSRGKTVTSRFGVAKNRWPHLGKKFNVVRFGNRDESETEEGESKTEEKDRVRELMKRLGYDGTAEGTQLDHVEDLNMGEKSELDQITNLWPLGTKTNLAAGKRQREQFENVEKSLGEKIDGRWFIISDIGLDPPAKGGEP